MSWMCSSEACIQAGFESNSVHNMRCGYAMWSYTIHMRCHAAKEILLLGASCASVVLVVLTVMCTASHAARVCSMASRESFSSVEIMWSG